MATLRSICESLYKVQDQSQEIEQCVGNANNANLKNASLEQIHSKCSPLSPLKTARECARDLGMEAPEPSISTAPRYQPDGSLIEGSTDRTSLEECEAKCDKEFYYNEKKMSQNKAFDLYTKCLDTRCHGETIREIAADKGRQGIKDDIRNFSFWGRFSVKLAGDVSRRQALYRDAFTKWNSAEIDPMPFNDGVMDTGWRSGVRVAVTTGPGLARWPGKNILIRFTPIDLTFGRQEPDKNFGFKNQVTSPHTVGVKLLCGSFLVPFFSRNFFEIGTSYIDKDMLWLTNSNPLAVIVPTNFHIGLNWQFRGTPIKVDDPVKRFRTGMPGLLSAYAMLGMRIEFAAKNPYFEEKAAEFCNQAFQGCGGKFTAYKDASYYFDYGYVGGEHPDGDHNSSGLSPLMGGRNFKDIRLTTHTFGEERWKTGGLVYDAYLNFYPRWGKIEPGAMFNFYLNIGEAMDLYLQASARYLYSLEKDGKVLLPDQGYELGVQSGLSFRSSSRF